MILCEIKILLETEIVLSSNLSMFLYLHIRKALGYWKIMGGYYLNRIDQHAMQAIDLSFVFLFPVVGKISGLRRKCV